MEFKRARNKEQFEQRESDIMNAAISIYEEYGFEEVTFSKISEKTKFTRSTIYSYFKTKEEIMLRLTTIYLEQYITWIKKKLQMQDEKNNDFVADVLTESFVEVPEFIRLYTVLFSIIEKNVSVEALTHFKREVIFHQYTLANTLKGIYPQTSDEEINDFLLFYLSFASGFCPMREQSAIQKEAIRRSQAGCIIPDFIGTFKRIVLVYLEKLESK